MNNNLAWTHMIDVLNGTPMDTKVLASVIANSIGEIVNYRIIGKKKND
jgi:hypothetical protein